MIVALDGPAASGKGTLGRRLAAHFGLRYLDTGLLYRATGIAVLRAGGDPSDPKAAAAAARALTPALLHDPALRHDEAAQAGSTVAASPDVRPALLAYQREGARPAPGAVRDGRAHGTVVGPAADAKICVTAGIEIRAERRFKELQERGLPVIYPAVLQDLVQRDERDSKRAVAPLRRSADALLLDTSDLDADQAFAQALAFIAEKAGGA